jgi:hypothetical protein
MGGARRTDIRTVPEVRRGAAMTPHCDDRSRDRAKGDATETAFKATMEAWGYPVELHPRDLDMWVDARAWPYPTLHEIKGKKPTAGDCFGLEKYRLAALLRHDETTPTFYTIHNDATGLWVTVRVSRLPVGRPYQATFKTYHGSVVEPEAGFFWPSYFFDPLAEWLAP